ncbi:hypothetical protein C2845_PM03G34560 [Panicum miliaceum]|uniref:Uncharacterized protein n=1 Tax=Panicum miliaceum TaxID=4540 RepID=A0A3L6T8Z0_PANMI|nr:hypothetical protein C2845_PM03G34560 [Panicum miliaceum]
MALVRRGGVKSAQCGRPVVRGALASGMLGGQGSLKSYREYPSPSFNSFLSSSASSFFNQFAECSPECARRCGNTQYRKPCLFFCNKWCSTCLCECPCYNNWKTKRGGPKCP